MKSNHLAWRIAALALAAIMILSGCSAPAAQSTLVPTIDLQPTLDAVAKEAAKTVVAGLTASAPTATPVVPTSTLAPSSTPIPSFTPPPTFTPAPPTATFIPWTATPAVTATSAVCSITSASPAYGADFDKNAPFDGNWTVKNLTSTTWSKDSTDFKFISGTKFQDNKDLTVLDFKSDVAKNETYNVIVDMTAPNTSGRYSATWAFVQGSNVLCYVSLTIDVK